MSTFTERMAASDEDVSAQRMLAELYAEMTELRAALVKQRADLDALALGQPSVVSREECESFLETMRDALMELLRRRRIVWLPTGQMEGPK